jgi:hypothetical protein
VWNLDTNIELLGNLKEKIHRGGAENAEEIASSSGVEKKNHLDTKGTKKH